MGINGNGVMEMGSSLRLTHCSQKVIYYNMPRLPLRHFETKISINCWNGAM